MNKLITLVAIASALHLSTALAADTSALTVNKGSNKAGDGNSVRYIQVVPEITNLPDMEAAMVAAKALL